MICENSYQNTCKSALRPCNGSDILGESPISRVTEKLRVCPLLSYVVQKIKTLV